MDIDKVLKCLPERMRSGVKSRCEEVARIVMDIGRRAYMKMNTNATDSDIRVFLSDNLDLVTQKDIEHVVSSP